MKQVHLKPLHHRGQESIGIYYDNFPSLNGIVKKLPGAKWSQTNRCWHVDLNPECYNQLYRALNGKAELNVEALKEYLVKRKKIVAAAAPAKSNMSIDKPIPPALMNETEKSKAQPAAPGSPARARAERSAAAHERPLQRIVEGDSRTTRSNI